MIGMMDEERERERKRERERERERERKKERYGRIRDDRQCQKRLLTSSGVANSGITDKG